MKILLISYSSLKKGPRQNRQLKLLSKKHKVHAIGSEPSGYENVFFELKSYSFFISILRLILIKFRLYDLYFWDKYKRELRKEIKDIHYDLIIVHEIRVAPLAFSLSKKCPIILDAHEYSPLNFDDSFLWRFFKKKYYLKLCNDYIPLVDKMFTVSEGIVNRYHKDYNKKPILITNAAEYQNNIKPIDINPKKIKLIHHGNASSSRKIELLIEMMDYLNSNYELSLMLVSSSYRSFYLKKLKKLSKGKNIKFIDPVSKNELIKFSNNFDIGIHFVPPTNFNLKYGLGNKFFEFIQSRLAIAIGPDIEMSKYVKKYNLGIISKSWEPMDMAEMIVNTSNQKIMFHKKQSDKYAMELSSKKNIKLMEKIFNTYEN